MGIAIGVYFLIAALCIYSGDTGPKFLGLCMIIGPIAFIIYAITSPSEGARGVSYSSSTQDYKQPEPSKVPPGCNSELKIWHGRINRQINGKVYFGENQVWLVDGNSEELLGYYYKNLIYNCGGKRDSFFEDRYDDDQIVACLSGYEVYSRYAYRSGRYRPEEMYGYCKDDRNIYKKYTIGEGEPIAWFERESETREALAAAYLIGLIC